MRKNKKKGGSVAALTVLCIVLGLILAALITVTAYAHHLLSMVNRVEESVPTLSQEQLDVLQAEETVAPDAPTDPVIREEDLVWETVEKIEKKENVVNILLIGQDAREGWGRSRSDAMILCTFNPEEKTITLTSFLRDLYVQIPGYQDNKLNAAYPAGGMELLNEALEVNFGVEIDGNVEVDFSRFADVIDLVGGVELELRSDEAGLINKSMEHVGIPGSLSAGWNLLSGEQALTYSRIRSLDADADFSRTNRQRKVINALIEKFRNSDLPTLLDVLEGVLPMLTTDLSTGQMIGYATDLFPMLAGCTIVSQRVPADGAYSLATIRGMACVVADMEAARILLEQTIGK